MRALMASEGAESVAAAGGVACGATQARSRRVTALTIVEPQWAALRLMAGGGGGDASHYRSASEFVV